MPFAAERWRASRSHDAACRRLRAVMADGELVGDVSSHAPACALPSPSAREQQLGDPVGFLEMRVAGADDGVDADRLVFAHALGDLLRRADQRRAGAAAHQADAGPQVGRDHQLVAPAAMQLGHAPLADRIHLLAEALPARSRSARR